MKKIMVLSMAVMALALSGCSGKEGSAADKKFVFTVAHASTEATSIHKLLVQFKADVEQDSGGRITVNLYPNAQLGGDREMIEGCQSGNITMVLSSNAVQVNFVPDAVIFDLPFVYPSLAVARRTLLDPEFIKKISASYAAYGFRYLGAYDQGFRTLTANKEIRSPADMQGLTMRTMENKYHMGAWRAIGANPTPLAFNELYTGLQQGTVDAQENPVELIYSQKFYEQQKYIILTNHILQTIVWIMNENVYQELPEDLKKIVDQRAQELLNGANRALDESVAFYESEMKKYGSIFVELSSSELQAFSDRAKAMWETVRADCSPEVYDAYMAALEKAQ